MKSKLAQLLRKCANLIDPGVKPTDAGSIHFNIDARGADAQRLERVIREGLAANAGRLVRVPQAK